MQEIQETVDLDRQVRSVAHRLGYAGLLPFAFCAAIVWLQPTRFSGAFLDDLIVWVLLYGAIILSFMGGASWGSALRTGRYGRMGAGVVFALVGWLAVAPAGLVFGFAPTTPGRFLILFFAFTGLIVSEILAREWSGWYMRLRVKLSLATICLLLLTILGLSY